MYRLALKLYTGVFKLKFFERGKSCLFTGCFTKIIHAKKNGSIFDCWFNGHLI